MKEILIPVVTAIVIGLGASIMTAKYNEGATVAWRQSIEVQITSMKVLVQAVQTNQLELASRGTWMNSVDKELVDIESRLDMLEVTKLSKKDSLSLMKAAEKERNLLLQRARTSHEKDVDILRLEARARHGESIDGI